MFTKLKIFALLLLAAANCSGQIGGDPGMARDTNYFLYAPLYEGQGNLINDWKGGLLGVFSNTSWVSPGVISVVSNAPFGTNPEVFFIGTSALADNPTNMTAAIWLKYTGAHLNEWWFDVLGKMGGSTNPVETGTGWMLIIIGADSGANQGGLAGACLQNNSGNSWLLSGSNTKVTDGTWHWIVSVFTGGAGGATAAKVYVDGVAGTTNYPQGSWSVGTANTGSIQINGAKAHDATGSAQLAQPTIITWALSSGQVTTLYGTATGVAGNTPSVDYTRVIP